MNKNALLGIAVLVVAVVTLGFYVAGRQGESPLPTTAEAVAPATRPSASAPASAEPAQPTAEPRQAAARAPSQPPKPKALASISPLPAEKPSECIVPAPSAPLKVEVFSDFECPACRELYLNTTRPLLADYGMAGLVCVVYHDFPLKQHKHSRQAAYLALAARRLGPQKWIQVTDMLYYYQGQWAQNGRFDPVLDQALPPEEVAIVKQWSTDTRLAAEVDADVRLGTERQVRSTPTLFITARGKTERFTGVIQYGILKRYLDQVLAQP
jgi:protein-disulfide isomerase